MEVKVMSAIIKGVENVNIADTTQTVPLFELPPGAYPIAFGGRVKTAFAGVTYPTVKVGEGTILDGFIFKQPINKVGDLKSGFSINAHTFCQAIAGGGQKIEANRSIIGTFESVTGNLSSLSAGEIEFFLVYAD